MSVVTDRRHASTPQSLADWAIKRYGLTLDVCASAWNAKLPRYYDLDRGEDGLELPWDAGVWCNPPWADIRRWLGKTVLEVYAAARCPVAVLCLPYRPAVKWWFEYIRAFANHLVEIEGRITYESEPGKLKGNGGYEATVLAVFEPRLKARHFN